MYKTWVTQLCNHDKKKASSFRFVFLGKKKIYNTWNLKWSKYGNSGLTLLKPDQKINIVLNNNKEHLGHMNVYTQFLCGITAPGNWIA